MDAPPDPTPRAGREAAPERLPRAGPGSYRYLGRGLGQLTEHLLERAVVTPQLAQPPATLAHQLARRLADLALGADLEPIGAEAVAGIGLLHRCHAGEALERLARRSRVACRHGHDLDARAR